jgi:hypothetical protein
MAGLDPAIHVLLRGVRLEVTLPWLWARFGLTMQRVVRQGQLMLEKK